MAVSDSTFEGVHRRLTEVEAENERLLAEIAALRELVAALPPTELTEPGLRAA